MSKDEYKLSRAFYVTMNALEHTLTLLTGGAYLAKLTTTIGISDGMTAILSMLASFATAFQVFSIMLSGKTPVKRWLAPLHSLAHVFLALIYLLPFFTSIKASVAFFILITLARVFLSIISPAKSTWLLSLVDDDKRVKFVSKSTVVALVSYSIASVIISSMIDKFESKGDTNAAFLAIFFIMATLIIVDICLLLFTKEKPAPRVSGVSPLKSVGELFRNKHFKYTFAVYVLVDFALAFSTPFYGTYQINELGFSMTFVAVSDIVVSIVQILTVYAAGRFSKGRSSAAIFRYSHIFAAAAFIFVPFSNAENGRLLFTAYRILYAMYVGTYSVSYTNLIFDIVPAHQRTSAFAVKSMGIGIVGFTTTVLTSLFVERVQANGNVIFGINAYAQQILSVLTFLILASTVIFHEIFGRALLECGDNAGGGGDLNSPLDK